MKNKLAAATVVICAFAGLLGAFSTVSVADPLERYAAENDVLIYLGIKPAAAIKEHPENYAELHARGTVPRGSSSYYVFVALFDASSGERISNAAVQAQISPLALSGPKRELQPVSIAGAVTYGNYFILAGKDTYSIKIEIRQPERQDLVHAKFEYRHKKE